MERHTAKRLSKITSVSVRTLHYYDEIGLLKPAIRSEARYRLYGEDELLRLQEIIFLKELDFSLKEIAKMLDDPKHERSKGLENRRKALVAKRERIERKIILIDDEILKEKNKNIISEDELFEGFPNGKALEIRDKAIEKYGREEIEISELYLKKLAKNEFEKLKCEQREIFRTLLEMSDQAPKAESVQLATARHYKNVRKFWGTDGSIDSQWRRYRGLGALYMADEQFCLVDGVVQPGFSNFLSQAMFHFASQQLQ